MKYPILILSLLAFTTAIYAQKPRIETFGDRRIETYTFKRAGDSIRFTIFGKNDTLEERKFHRNGKLSSIFWRKDSSAMYDVLGRLTGKLFGSDVKNLAIDSAYAYYPNGQLEGYFKPQKNSYLRIQFDENGQLISTTNTQIFPSRSTTVISDNDGKKIIAYRIDTIIKNGEKTSIRYDTVFYANERPMKTSITENFNPTLGTQFYNEAGELIYSIHADSLKLILFKDNVDCYYGLKNNRGDTVVKPRFDLITEHNEHFFAAYTGESAILLDKNGAPMTPPVSRLGKIEALSQNESTQLIREFKHIDNRIQLTESLVKMPKPVYYAFMEGKKYGVMSEKGTLVMPPQYLPIRNLYINDGDYFGFDEYISDSLIRTGFLNRQGKALFTEGIKKTQYSEFEDYFYINARVSAFNPSTDRHESAFSIGHLDQDELNDLSENKLFGLGKSDGKMVLPLKFLNITHVQNTPLFVTTIVKINQQNQKAYHQEGIFDVHRQKWLVDTTHFIVENKIENDCVFFIIKNIATQKYGVMDTTGKYIVPLSYDSIGIASQEQGLFWVKKGGKFQILSIKNGQSTIKSTQFDFLAPFNFEFYGQSKKEEIVYFIARRKDKWGVIDVQEKIIKPFDSDYASINQHDKYSFILVKNNRAAAYGLASLPNETYSFRSGAKTIRSESNDKQIDSYPLLDNSERVFFANDTGKVMIPPQYKPLSRDYNTGFVLTEDLQKRKKIIYLESGKVIDYPFDYNIKFAPAKSRVVVVNDTSFHSFGVVSTDGKVLVPCVNYGVAIGDADNSIFFVKRDTFAMPDSFFMGYSFNLGRMGKDTLSLEDNDWLMYNGDGKIVTDKPFRFPIVFNKGIGIGMQTEGFNLYKNDGTVLTPFVKNKENSKILPSNTEGSILTYNNIWRDPQMGFYALFRNQGMTPTMTLTNENGEILVENGRFDGISKFYDKYAVVTAKAKVGLIDTLGRTIIEPQDLRTYEGQFMDSLDIVNAQIRENVKNNIFDFIKQRQISQPYAFYYNYDWHPDSLKITTAQRSILWNLLLEKCLNTTIVTASDTHIPRTELKATTFGFSMFSKTKVNSQLSLNRVVVSEKTMSFSTNNNIDFEAKEKQFYNFYRRDNRWEELYINDLLQVQGEKRWLMNDLITKKVKALKDQQIDCSNASAFIGQVENKFMLTKDGVDFCFDSTGNTYKQSFVVISFTWAELTPFLKMKIY